jgi:hypothetical protein
MSSETDFAFFRPVDVTAAMLTSSNIAEPAASDPAAWVSGTSYTAGTSYVSRASTHRKYLCQVSTSGTTAPESDAAHWLDAGPLNRWAMFDAANESASSNSSTITVTLTPGERVDCIAFDNVDADTIRVQAGSTYDQTIQLRTRVVEGWWDYFFERFAFKTAAVFLNLPPISTNVITITITKNGGTAMCGTCKLGLRYRVGGTRYGASSGMLDYSYRSTDQFGNTTVIEGAYAKRMNVALWVKNEKAEDTKRLLETYRATPLVWVGAGNLFSSLIIYGYCRRFEKVIDLPNYSVFTLEIEGLT